MIWVLLLVVLATTSICEPSLGDSCEDAPLPMGEMCRSPFAAFSCMQDGYFRGLCCATCSQYPATLDTMPESYFLQEIAGGVTNEEEESEEMTCKDRSEMCSSFFNQFACVNDLWFQLQCPLTCGVCVGPNGTRACMDNSMMCGSVFAPLGCAVNNSFFTQHCPVTCKLCEPAPTTMPWELAVEIDVDQDSNLTSTAEPANDTTTNWLPESTPSNQTLPALSTTDSWGTTYAPVSTTEGPCEDELPPILCRAFWSYWACRNPCSDYQWKCRESCGLCQPESSTTELAGTSTLNGNLTTPSSGNSTDEPCEDVYPLVLCRAFWSYWACSDPDSDYQVNCRKSCGICQSDDSEDDGPWFGQYFQWPELDQNSTSEPDQNSTNQPDQNSTTDLEPTSSASAGPPTQQMTTDASTSSQGQETSVGPSASTTVEPILTTSDAPVPTTTEEPCEDELPSFLCKASWAHYACDNPSSDFQQKCRKSCGLCTPDSADEDEAAPIDFQSLDFQQQGAPNDGGCEDRLPEQLCAGLTEKRGCVYGLQDVCKKTCNVCSPEAAQKSQALPVIAAARRSRRSALTTAQPAPETTTVACDDELPEFVCESAWAKFACLDVSSKFAQSCRRSCGLCGGEVNEWTLHQQFIYAVNNQENALCVDIGCPYMCSTDCVQSFGCENDPLTKLLCRESCGLCSPADDEQVLSEGSVEALKHRINISGQRPVLMTFNVQNPNVRSPAAAVQLSPRERPLNHSRWWSLVPMSLFVASVACVAALFLRQRYTIRRVSYEVI